MQRRSNAGDEHLRHTVKSKPSSTSKPKVHQASSTRSKGPSSRRDSQHTSQKSLKLEQNQDNADGAAVPSEIKSKKSQSPRSNSPHPRSRSVSLPRQSKQGSTNKLSSRDNTNHMVAPIKRRHSQDALSSKPSSLIQRFAETMASLSNHQSRTDTYEIKTPNVSKRKTTKTQESSTKPKEAAALQDDQRIPRIVDDPNQTNIVDLPQNSKRQNRIQPGPLVSISEPKKVLTNALGLPQFFELLQKVFIIIDVMDVMCQTHLPEFDLVNIYADLDVLLETYVSSTSNYKCECPSEVESNKALHMITRIGNVSMPFYRVIQKYVRGPKSDKVTSDNPLSSVKFFFGNRDDFLSEFRVLRDESKHKADTFHTRANLYVASIGRSFKRLCQLPRLAKAN